MQVLEINRLKELADIKRKKKVASSGFSEILSSEFGSEAEVASVQNIASTEPLLFLQEIGSLHNKAEKSIMRGEDVLEKLEELRNNILSGNINQRRLEDIKNSLAQEREKTEDEKLEGIIDEIELRALVELAKYESR